MTLFNAAGEPEHAALATDAAAQHWKVHLWVEAVEKEISKGEVFSADTLQAKHNLPDLANGTGGVFMRLHQQGRIRRLGFRPSTKATRAGSFVAIWTGVRNAA